MPRDLVGVLVHPSVELPGKPALADAGDAGHGHQAASAVAHDRAHQRGQLLELSIAPNQASRVHPGSPPGRGILGARGAVGLEAA